MCAVPNATNAGGGHDLLSGLVRGVRRAHDGTFTAHFEVPGDLGLGLEGDLGGAAARGLNAVAELLQSGGWAAAGGNRRNRTFRWAAGWRGAGRGWWGPVVCHGVFTKGYTMDDHTRRGVGMTAKSVE